MTSLNNILENLSNINNEGNIDMAIKYVKEINEPLLNFEDYKKLKEELEVDNYENNMLLISQFRHSAYNHTRAKAAQFEKITKDMIQIQEYYVDDFI